MSIQKEDESTPVTIPGINKQIPEERWYDNEQLEYICYYPDGKKQTTRVIL
jgi:hypothetical protein